jgi:hypothetical protein
VFTEHCSGFSDLKHLGFADFPMTNGFNFSPVQLAANKTVKRSLLIFPALHWSCLVANVLSGIARNTV